jgi:hypothetical protein
VLGNRAYALDWMVVLEVARTMGITTNETFFNLLKTFEDEFIRELNGGK